MNGLDLKFAPTKRHSDSLMSRVEAVLLQVEHLTLQELSARLTEPASKLRITVRNLIKANRAHEVTLGAVQQFAWGPEPRETVAQKPNFHTREAYVPAQWSNEIARPGGEAHKQYGSRQADGSITPYRAPAYGLVGQLKDKTNNARDA
jgi:hypothetical protein